MHMCIIFPPIYADKQQVFPLREISFPFLSDVVIQKLRLPSTGSAERGGERRPADAYACQTLPICQSNSSVA